MAELQIVRKLKHSAGASAANEPLQYYFENMELTARIGSEFQLEFTGRIFCLECGRKTSKSFNQGYCFPCFKKLAACDLCILKPQLCHYHEGTCREPDWAKGHCLLPHFVYLANSSNLKVGLTRQHKAFERWGDQGAIQAICIAKVPERKLAGFLEVEIAKSISDKSDWRQLLTSAGTEIDLLAEAKKIMTTVSAAYQAYLLDTESVEFRVQCLRYPVRKYLEKARLHNLDRDKIFQGKLEGFRGQYLLTSDLALNFRKYQGYEIKLSI